MNSENLELARRAARGDEEAFEEIYLSYRNQVQSHIYGMVGDRLEAEDLSQEVFLRAYQAMHTYSGKASLSRWLKVIATNLCIDRLRKRTISCVAWPSMVSKDGDRQTVDLPDDSPSPEDSVQSSDGTRVILEAIDALPSHYRHAVILYDVMDQSGDSVARHLGCPSGTVKSRLSRAHGILRTQLAGEGVHSMVAGA